MDAERLLQFLTQLPFVLIFLIVAAEAVRRPYRAQVDIALFFGVMAVALVVGWVADIVAEERPAAVTFVIRSLVMALPYLLLRVVADFSEVPRWLVRVALAGFALAVAALAVMDELTVPAMVFLVAYVFGYLGYASWKFIGQARVSRGPLARRMRAAAIGSGVFGGTILLAGLRAVVPLIEPAAAVLVQLGVLTAGLAYLVGFAPPRVLRRAWQEPEVRGFLARATAAPRLPDADAVLRELEERAAAVIGAERATIMLWDPGDELLRAPTLKHDRRARPVRPGQYIAGRVFEAQRAEFSPNAVRDDPEHAAVYESWGARAVMAAPITVSGRRLGVLTVYSPRPPIFAHHDLALVELLAEQAALALESRRLLEDAAAVRAREEATRLKDDFLSSAAHDLNTPLTAVVAYAQLLERRAAARPDEPVDMVSVRRIAAEAERLRALIARMLDVAASEDVRLLKERVRVDLGDLAREVCCRESSERHPCVVAAETAVAIRGDADRLAQLIENLVQNAVKYSPRGGEVRIRVWRSGTHARLAVTDRGVGIPANDVPYIFERFRRGVGVDDRRFAGMGLGLYLSRLIVEQHGGRIWVESRPGEGSTFHVALPLNTAETE